MKMQLTCVLAVVTAVASMASANVVLLHDEFNFNSNSADFESTWSIAETGDYQMTWFVLDDVVQVRNSTSGGSNQSVIFGRRVDTTGYHSIHVRLGYYANAWDDFERSDFVRIRGYESGFLSLPVHIEATTEGDWPPGVNPPTTTTYLEADFGSYSFENPHFWVAVEVNTSLYKESIFLDSITVTGVPEPATAVLLAIGGLATLKRSRRK